MYQMISTQNEDGIFTITINRPEKMNALNQQVLKELALAVEEIYSDRTIKAAIITGAGEKAFVAGADISEFLTLSEENGRDLAQLGQVIFQRIENSPKPVVAAVNGFALGGGCELAMACHFRIASENARFGQPEVNLGLIPGYGGTQRLTQLVGKGKAMELMMSGDMISSADALSWGLVNYVVPAAELMSKTISILQKINAKAPLAVSRVIKCVNAAIDKQVDGYETELDEFAACFGTKDMEEGTAAFIQKRVPNFTGE
ncbi:enoyl-CoA hydratase [Chitinophaga silvatica]|uniref:Enoyl-CoA hydratase n=1 Tax=Chitinophaga silvatica TaxID=2282649 RepID=A0A3E1YAT8_9BACT|nr:enoyl-CoA hydratase-related protein [Chitinophaga silvatica]RFS22591.1 enoyl-CoA hydratase [Chitinophaga silvatica]